MTRRLAALLAGLALAAGTLVALSAPASASTCTPWPSCFGAAYQVTGTPDNSLWEWTYSPSLGGSTIRTIPNGYTLWVACQANDGPQEDGKYNVYPTVPSTTWDFAWDSGNSRYVWVYDWWMNTPPQQAAYNWYSWPDSAHHCNFSGPWPEQPALNDLLARIAGPPKMLKMGLHDNVGDTMDTVKVLQTGPGSYLGVYHTGDVVKLATSTDLVNWHYVTDLDTPATQPYIAREPDGSYLLADEHSGLIGSYVNFVHFSSPSSLMAGTSDWNTNPPLNPLLYGPRFFSSCNEGTPDIHGISNGGSTVDFGFHYNSDCSSGLDREAFGRFSITSIDYSTGQATATWSATKDTVRDNAVNAIGYPGKHGGRDDITWHGNRFSLQEAQNSNANLNDYTTWRFVLYDYTSHLAYPANITSSVKSPCHGNPKVTVLTDPNGNSVILVTAFIFGGSQGCVVPGESGGELVYTVPAH